MIIIDSLCYLLREVYWVKEIVIYGSNVRDCFSIPTYILLASGLCLYVYISTQIVRLSALADPGHQSHLSNNHHEPTPHIPDMQRLYDS